MPRALVTWLRVVLLASTCVWMVAPLAAAAEPIVSADFDGDGQFDRVTFDVHEPSTLHIWLSGTHTTATVHAPVPVRDVVARDLDGDRRAELIASGTRAGLHVWTRKQHGFRSFRARRAVPDSIQTPHRRAAGREPAGESPEIAASGPASLSLELTARPRAPDSASIGIVASAAEPSPINPRFTPLAPRPPPVASR